MVKIAWIPEPGRTLGRPRRSLPILKHRLTACADRHVGAVEPRVTVGKVAPLVRAAALGSGERATRYEAHERMRIAGQLLQPRAVALEARVSPQRLAAER